jgi:hypothetical protein
MLAGLLGAALTTLPCQGAWPTPEPSSQESFQAGSSLSWRSGRWKQAALSRVHHRPHLPARLLWSRCAAEHAVADEGPEQEEGPVGAILRDLLTRCTHRAGRPRPTFWYSGRTLARRERPRAPWIPTSAARFSASTPRGPGGADGAQGRVGSPARPRRCSSARWSPSGRV